MLVLAEAPAGLTTTRAVGGAGTPVAERCSLAVTAARKLPRGAASKMDWVWIRNSIRQPRVLVAKNKVRRGLHLSACSSAKTAFGLRCSIFRLPTVQSEEVASDSFLRIGDVSRSDLVHDLNG